MTIYANGHPTACVARVTYYDADGKVVGEPKDYHEAQFGLSLFDNGTKVVIEHLPVPEPGPVDADEEPAPPEG